MLKPGDIVPAFTGEAFYPEGDIRPFDLTATRGKWTVLFFWPLDFTFVCPTEIRGYNDLAVEFSKSDCTLLGASVDSAYVHRAWTEHGLGKMAFAMIGDVGPQLSSSLGILNHEGVALRATFIIDPDGVIQSVMVNGLDVGRSARETLRLTRAFQSGELTACDWQPGQAFVKAA